MVIFASSILSMESVLEALPVQRLKRNTLFVDVLSVKEFPKRLMLSILPPEVRTLCQPDVVAHLSYVTLLNSTRIEVQWR